MKLSLNRLSLFFIFAAVSSILFISSLTIAPSAAQEGQSSKQPSPTPPTETTEIPAELRRKIEPTLLNQLLSQPEETLSFIVYLTAQADSSTISTRAESSRLAKRTAIVQTLQETAQQSQGGVLTLLNSSMTSRSGQATTATEVRPLWIINAIAAQGGVDLVLELARRPDVEIIRLDKPIQLELPPTKPLEPLEPLDKLRQTTAPVNWGLQKIRADLVHEALGITGRGIVVANVDTGVDWQHPALQQKYRGFNGPAQAPQHLGNWFDAIEGGAYPIDSNDHGTHTMGTMVADEVGVAPGATWIAVRAFASNGTAKTSWLHAAYQWLLAPNDDPALAPDVVNNSWSNIDPANEEFAPDLQRLREAGVLMIFSSGNKGPGSGSVESPGSLIDSFSVGATDINDEVTNFSGRGPSPWNRVKPEVAAPGKGIVSTISGGVYGPKNGTSMAAPHVSGLAALLLESSPALNQDLASLLTVMTSTTVSLGDNIPNNNSGWGRIDAYNAVVSVASFGLIEGTVMEGTIPIPEAVIQITAANRDPITIRTTSDSSGHYRQKLVAGIYNVSVSAFGYQPTRSVKVVVDDTVSISQNFNLTPTAQGIVRGQIFARDSNSPISAAVSINDTPVETVADSVDGSYRLTLPVGRYTMSVVAKGYRIERQAIEVRDATTTIQDIRLSNASTILLVDGGRWQQESQISLYQQALDALNYQHDVWQITRPFSTTNDIPTAEVLSQYDIVMWSSPRASPGYLDADDELTDYLDQGGRLLLSGQDIAYFDGGGSTFGTRRYLKDYFKVKYVQDNAASNQLVGATGSPFEGMTLPFAKSDAPNGLISPDVITNADAEFAQPILQYADGDLAGLAIGICVPYRAIYLAFGFEGIDTPANRAALMDKLMAWLEAAPSPHGLELEVDEATMIGRFGQTVSHTVRLRNPGSEAGRYQLQLDGGTWPIQSNLPERLQIASCQSETMTITVTVDTAVWHEFDTLNLTAQSPDNPALRETVTRTTKSPAPVLLVDDDRFYSFAAEYRRGLEQNGIDYDYWLVPKSWVGPLPPSPPTDTLKMYPIVIWYTAYDWSTPLAPAEEQRLAAYLEQGGRLMFSSQDYIFKSPNSQPSAFAKNYLGIQRHTEDFTSTMVIGAADNPVGSFLGPYELTFPRGYNNWTDAVYPSSTASIATVGQAGQPNGLLHSGLGVNESHWHTIFLSYGPELLTEPSRQQFLNRAVGWLSWVGRSTLSSNTDTALDGDIVVYTATMTNDGWHDLPSATFTATFSSALIPTATSPELQLVDGQLKWQGSLARNSSKTFRYTAQVADSTPLGTVAQQRSWFSYDNHRLNFDQLQEVRLNVPDLSGSTYRVWPNQGIADGQLLTYTVTLHNDSLVTIPVVTVSATLSDTVTLLAVDSPPSPGSVMTSSQRITWTLPLSAKAVTTLTYRVAVSGSDVAMIVSHLLIDDGVQPLKRTAIVRQKTNDVYLPIFTKGVSDNSDELTN